MSVTTVLAPYKTALQGIVAPTGQDAPTVYSYPTDVDDMVYDVDGMFETLPVIVASENIAGEQDFTRVGAQVVHTWEIETLIFLAKGFFRDQIAAREVEALMPGWLTAYNTVLRNNKRLGGAIITFGNVAGDGRLFTVPRKGHMSWNGKEYWGIPILTSVSQIIA